MIDLGPPPLILPKPAIIAPKPRLITPAEARGIRTVPPFDPLLAAFGTAANQGARGGGNIEVSVDHSGKNYNATAFRQITFSSVSCDGPYTVVTLSIAAGSSSETLSSVSWNGNSPDWSYSTVSTGSGEDGYRFVAVLGFTGPISSSTFTVNMSAATPSYGRISVISLDNVYNWGTLVDNATVTTSSAVSSKTMPLDSPTFGGIRVFVAQSMYDGGFLNGHSLNIGTSVYDNDHDFVYTTVAYQVGDFSTDVIATVAGPGASNISMAGVSIR